MLNPTDVKSWLTERGARVSQGATLTSEDLGQLKHQMHLIGILEPTVDYAINHATVVTPEQLANPSFDYGAGKRQPVTLINPAYIVGKLDIKE